MTTLDEVKWNDIVSKEVLVEFSERVVQFKIRGDIYEDMGILSETIKINLAKIAGCDNSKVINIDRFIAFARLAIFFSKTVAEGILKPKNIFEVLKDIEYLFNEFNKAGELIANGENVSIEDQPFVFYYLASSYFCTKDTNHRISNDIIYTNYTTSINRKRGLYVIRTGIKESDEVDNFDLVYVEKHRFINGFDMDHYSARWKQYWDIPNTKYVSDHCEKITDEIIGSIVNRIVDIMMMTFFNFFYSAEEEDNKKENENE